MRKHKRIVLFVVLLFVIVPFTLWGGYSGSLGDRSAGGSDSIGKVGSKTISAEEYRQALTSMLRQPSQDGKETTFKDLAEDGRAQKALDDLINRALVEMELDKNQHAFTRAYLEERLKDDPQFKDDKGEFDKSLWNAWLADARRINWNAVYANLSDSLSRELFSKTVMAPVRVLDADLRTQFEHDFTKLKVKYAPVESPIEPTEEEVKAHYDKDPTHFQTNEQRTAEFVAFSLAPPKPDFLDKLIERMKAGEDWAALAKEYGTEQVAVSEVMLPWTTLDDKLPDQRKALVGLPVNHVSEPVEAAGALFIYKVEEERTKEGADLKEVRAHQMVVRSRLTPEARAAIEAKANEFATKAKENGDFAAAAQQAGIEITTCEAFSVDSSQIQNVASSDVFAFRSGASKVGVNEVSDIIPASANLYVARVTSIIPPVVRPYDEVKTDVRDALIEEIRRSPEQADKNTKLAEDVKAKAKTLAEVQTLFPDLKTEIKETNDFSVREPDYTQGVFWNPSEVFDALEGKEAGAFAGPIADFTGKQYFVELVSRTAPDDKTWEEKKKELKEYTLASAQNRHFQDYVANLKEKALFNIPIEIDQASVNLMLGIGEPAAEDAATTGPAEAPAQK